jgi:hypothetical protein
MTDPLAHTHALSAGEVAELTGEAEEQDETGAPELVAETENTVPIESSDRLGDGAPQPFTPKRSPVAFSEHEAARGRGHVQHRRRRSGLGRTE